MPHNTDIVDSNENFREQENVQLLFLKIIWIPHGMGTNFVYRKIHELKELNKHQKKNDKCELLLLIHVHEWVNWSCIHRLKFNYPLHQPLVGALNIAFEHVSLRRPDNNSQWIASRMVVARVARSTKFVLVAATDLSSESVRFYAHDIYRSPLLSCLGISKPDKYVENIQMFRERKCVNNSPDEFIAITHSDSCACRHFHARW